MAVSDRKTHPEHDRHDDHEHHDPASDRASAPEATPAETLRVLAHPLRSRLFNSLRGRGRATATDLAALLGTNSGATSYHLRKLEAVGLVRDTHEGQGKRRLWEPTPDSSQWQPSDVDGDVDSETALGWLTRDYAHHFSEQYDRWLEVADTWPIPWQDACGSTDASVLVTTESLAALRAEMAELVGRYRRVGQGNPSARRIAVYTFAYPIDLGRPPQARDAGPHR